MVNTDQSNCYKCGAAVCLRPRNTGHSSPYYVDFGADKEHVCPSPANERLALQLAIQRIGIVCESGTGIHGSDLRTVLNAIVDLRTALDAKTGECADLWNSIRTNERAAYDADNSLDVAQLDAMSLDLSRQVGEHLAEIASLRAALDKAGRERDEARTPDIFGIDDTVVMGDDLGSFELDPGTVAIVWANRCLRDRWVACRIDEEDEYEHEIFDTEAEAREWVAAVHPIPDREGEL